MNQNHPLFGIEKVRPVKIIQYWPYEKAYIRRPTGEEYTFNFMHSTMANGEGSCASLREYLADLYKKKAQEGIAKGEPKKDFPGVGFWPGNPEEVLFTPDNKEVYLYETEDGREIAVGYKDWRVIFGYRKDIQDYHSGKSLF